MCHELTIAAAQLNSVKGNLKENTKRHLALIKLAAKEKVDVLIFPELSLTGYEPELARFLAMKDNDHQLAIFKVLADMHNMVIMVGAPVEYVNEKPKIGLFIARPGKGIFHYTKMHLHQGEDKFFSVGMQSQVLQINKDKIGIAICADTSHPSHVSHYSNMGASLYISSMLVTSGGYDNDTDRLKQYAKENGITVVMSNHTGPTGGWEPIGKSAIWNEQGDLVSSAKGDESSLVIGQRNGNFWTGRVVSV